MFLIVVPFPSYAFTSEQEGWLEAIAVNAKENGVNPAIAVIIAQEESRFHPDAVGDLTYKCRNTGKLSPSYGMVQINLCHHPDISIKQALDPYFSMNFLIQELKKGNCHIWSTCPLNTG